MFKKTVEELLDKKLKAFTKHFVKQYVDRRMKKKKKAGNDESNLNELDKGGEVDKNPSINEDEEIKSGEVPPFVEEHPAKNVGNKRKSSEIDSEDLSEGSLGHFKRLNKGETMAQNNRFQVPELPNRLQDKSKVAPNSLLNVYSGMSVDLDDDEKYEVENLKSKDLQRTEV